jgi:hypothetical protein
MIFLAKIEIKAALLGSYPWSVGWKTTLHCTSWMCVSIRKYIPYMYLQDHGSTDREVRPVNQEGDQVIYRSNFFHYEAT